MASLAEDLQSDTHSLTHSYLTYCGGGKRVSRKLDSGEFQAGSHAACWFANFRQTSMGGVGWNGGGKGQISQDGIVKKHGGESMMDG